MNARATSLAFALFGIALGGCPPDVEEPDPPPGRSCESAADCVVEGEPCGLVWACVAEVCEEDPSRSMPCDGGP